MRPCAAREEVHSFQDFPIGPSGRHKSDVRAARQVLGPVDTLFISDAHLFRATPLVIVAKAQSAKYFRTEAPERSRGEHALKRAARTHDGVHVRSGDRPGERRHEVAVLDELYARAGVATVIAQLS